VSHIVLDPTTRSIKFLGPGNLIFQVKSRNSKKCSSCSRHVIHHPSEPISDGVLLVEVPPTTP